MKKLILSMVAVSTMLAAGAANAQAPYSNQLDFNGTITNYGPIWTWSIPAASVQKAKNWTTDKSRGVISGDNLVFDFSPKGSISFLEGNFNKDLPKPTPGFLPVVTIKTADGDVKLAYNSPKSLKFTAKDGTKNVGNMTLSANQDLLVAEMGKDTIYWQYNEIKTGDWVGLIQDQLQNTSIFNKVYKGESISKWSIGGTPASTILSSGKGVAKNILAAYLGRVSNIKLIVPHNAVPTTWTVSLPMTVTYS